MAIAHNSTLNVKTETFLKERLSVAMAVPREYLEVFTERDYLTESLRVQMDRYIWSQEVGTVTRKHPATWWDMLKLNHAPAWFTKRFPVRFNEVVFKATALFPNFTPPMRAGDPVMRLQVAEPFSIRPYTS